MKAESAGGVEEEKRRKKEEQRRRRNEKKREMVACKYCGKMVSRGGMARHQKAGRGKDPVTDKHIPCSDAAVAAGVVCNRACCK